MTSDDYKPPIVSFEKISAHTLKAIVTDQHTSNLFVQMDIYGYEPNDKPVAFQSYLTSDQEAAAETTMSDDLENDSIQLPLTAKRRTRVHFQTHHEPEDLSVVDGCNGAVGHLVIGNCLIGLMTSASVALVSRYTL